MSSLLLLSCLLAGEPDFVEPPPTPTMATATSRADLAVDRPRRRAPFRKGQRLLLGAGIAYGLGAGVQWATAAGGGALDNDRARNGDSMQVGYTLGMVMGGAGQLEGVVFGAMGGRQLGRERRNTQHLSTPLRASGGVLLGLGAATAIGTGMFWPTIRERCTAGVACGLAGVQAGSAALTLGASMVAYGDAVRPADRRRDRLPKKAVTPLAVGGFFLAQGYFSASLIGMLGWQGDRDSAAARRIRNRMLIPVAGPWIVAAGPDAPLPLAIVTAGLGAMQIGGMIALGVGTARATRARRRDRLHIALAPTGTGVSISGRF